MPLIFPQLYRNLNWRENMTYSDVQISTSAECFQACSLTESQSFEGPNVRFRFPNKARVATENRTLYEHSAMLMLSWLSCLAYDVP